MARPALLTWTPPAGVWWLVVRAAVLFAGIGLIVLNTIIRLDIPPPPSPSLAAPAAPSEVGAEDASPYMGREEIANLFREPPIHITRMLKSIYTYLGHPERCCRDLRTVGGRRGHTDGSKMICDDAPVAPTGGECLVYSFGVGNDWSFDKAMSDRGCDVHSFDPSLSRAEGRTEYGAVFHRQGLSGDFNETLHGEWKVMTLGTTMERLGHAGRALDYLKVDVEGSEWDWLEMEDFEVLRHVRQLAMEIHFFDLQVHKHAVSVEAMSFYYTAFQTLNDLGFCLVSVKENPIDAGRVFLSQLAEEKATLFEVLWVKR